MKKEKKLKLCCVFYNIVDSKGRVSKGKGKGKARKTWLLATTEEKAKEYVIAHMKEINGETVDLNTISCDPV